MKNLIAGQEKVLSWIVKVHTILIGGVHLYFDFTIAPDVGTFFFFFLNKALLVRIFLWRKKKYLSDTLYLIIVMRIWCFTFFSTLSVILRWWVRMKGSLCAMMHFYSHKLNSAFSQNPGPHDLKSEALTTRTPGCSFLLRPSIWHYILLLTKYTCPFSTI